MRDHRHTFLHPTAIGSVAALLAFGCAEDPTVEVETVEPVELKVEENTAAVTKVSVDPEASNSMGEVRSADSHVHGGATLSMAVDGSTIAVELETPLYNLLGFEHAPDTDAQRDGVVDAERWLATPGELVVFNAEVGCEAADVDDVALFDGDGHDEDYHHDEDDHHLDDEHHDKEHHDDDHGDDHAHGDEHDDHGVHRDALVTYSFTCDSIADLRSADVAIVSVFPLMEEVDVVYLGPDTQKSFELSGSRTTIDLRP